MEPFDTIKEPRKLDLLICFCDIESFASIAQSQVDPVGLFLTLSGMATLIDTMVKPSAGLVIKFIGDSALVVFPDSAADAGVRLLLDMKGAVEQYLKGQGFNSKLRFCVHFGEAVIGPFGDTGRLDIVGDHVNLTARLGRGEHRGRFIISPQAFRKLRPETRKLFHKFTPPIVYLAEGGTAARPKGGTVARPRE